jgi:hypothetical protein
MNLIQLRIHPGVGMARIGSSKDWYFLGPEIPRFLQEQYPNLRHVPSPLRHPATTNSTAAQPDQGNYRDKGDKKQIMPQAARFRVFAYVYNGDERDPYKVVEVTSADADIEWKVKLANVKSVKGPSDSRSVDPNAPPEKPLSTKAPSPPAGWTDCKTSSGSLPNLAYLKLETEKDVALLANTQPAAGAEGKWTGRLHVIGNEGDINGDTLKTSKGDLTLTGGENPFLYQNQWYDSAADGPVGATVELRDSFIQKFQGAKFLVPGQKDPVPLPQDKKVAAVSAWVVVNLPDYLPDMGHFVSLWDLALSQSWLYVARGDADAVDGQHHLAVSPREVVSYGFYDYYLHIHPQLGLFSDLPYVSGQARAGSGYTAESYTKGSTVHGTLSVDSSGGSIKIPLRDALRVKAASLGQFPFSVLLTQDTADPLATGKFELLSCSKVEVAGDVGVLTVAGMQGAWGVGIPYLAGTKGGFVETPLLKSIDAHETVLTVAAEAAYRMPQPTPLGRDSPFKLALSAGGSIEWVTCTENAKILGLLTVTRGEDGTTAQEWGVLGFEATTVIAPAMGHKTLDARANAGEFDTDRPEGTQAWVRSMIFPRLRHPSTVYDRWTFKKHDTAKPTGYPREFGRRMEFDKVSKDADFSDGLNVDPGGSLARYHNIFAKQRTLSCRGRSLPLDHPEDGLPAKLPDEKYKETPETHIRWLDDYYWIVSARDMPMLLDYAFAHMQYGQFQAWAEGHESKRLFEGLFKGSDLESLFKASPASPIESYLNELFKKRSRFAPAFLDMASTGKMVGGSFLPGIEVGREAGKPQNWSLYRGGTPYFPDVRFQPQGKSDPHPAGILTKDLAVPWFADYIDCVESFWPTSRPQVVFDDKGIGYSWLDLDIINDDLLRRRDAATHGSQPAWDVLPSANPTVDQAVFKEYWTRLGFIRRQQDGKLAEKEALFHRS